MTDNPQLPQVDDPLKADVQEALLAAFGEEAMEWLDEDDADLETQALSQVEDSDTAQPMDQLSALLEKLSSAVEDGLSPGALGDLDSGAEETEEEAQQEAGPRHVVFQVGDQLYALPLTGVLEIDRCGKVTTLPRTPSWLRGVTNLRGQILSVTDFRSLLELTSDRQSVGEKIIVVQSERHDARTALVVDRVLGIRNLSGERGPLEGLSDRVVDFASSLSVSDQATTVLIDPDLLLGCDELKSFASE